MSIVENLKKIKEQYNIIIVPGVEVTVNEGYHVVCLFPNFDKAIEFAKNQYNEGVHAPNVDGVILGRETRSDIVFFEQIGRALSVRGDSYKGELQELEERIKSLEN